MSRQKSTLGIDEAGRGPVLGQMVLAAVVLDTRGARRLTRKGLRDSKAYGAGDKARAIRAQLAEEVERVALHVGVRVVDVCEIDRRVARGELNALERDVARELIARAPAVDRIVADGSTLFGGLRNDYSNLEALDRAESQHAAVAAASVIAKHRRDRLFECIQRRYQGEFGEVRGGGYGNAATQRFLRAFADRYRDLPPEARRSWPYPYLEDILGSALVAPAPGEPPTTTVRASTDPPPANERSSSQLRFSFPAAGAPANFSTPSS